MSAFRDLLKQAHERGAKRFNFSVDLDAFFGDAEAESWDADNDRGGGAHVHAQGRTGEEALRRLVEALADIPDSS